MTRLFGVGDQEVGKALCDTPPDIDVRGDVIARNAHDKATQLEDSPRPGTPWTTQVDGAYVRVRQHATGARKRGVTPATSRKLQAIGRPRGGPTTRIIVLSDRGGRLARFSIAPGNVGEVRALAPLLEGVETGELIADSAYDSGKVRRMLAARGIVATIKPLPQRKVDLPWNRWSYERRHLVENLFADLKQFRGIATRHCKLASRYEALLCLTAWYVATR